MTPQLFSIEHAPPSLPIWQVIVEDLAHPPVKRIARVLGLHERTVYRYHRTGQAPRAVLLALFWLTRWGRSAVHTQATNDALMACALVRGLERRVGELTAQVGHLQRLGGYGSANAPLVHADPLPDGRLFIPEGDGQLPGSTLHPVLSAQGVKHRTGGQIDPSPAGRGASGPTGHGQSPGPGGPGAARPANAGRGPEGPPA